MEYLLKVSLVLTLFYFSYKVFLQRHTFFEANRWFLLMGFVTSFVIPFVVIPKYIEYTPPNFEKLMVVDEAVTEINIKPFNILDYLPLVYALGVILFFGRFLIQLTSLIAIISKHKSSKKGNYVFVETTNNVSPFSFFKYIVYNPNQFNKTELEQILIHEKVHVTQQHSIDILLSQLSCILLWFNPIAWFYTKDLKQNLEFIADKNALNKQVCEKDYQYTLLKTSMLNHQSVLINNFYNSSIKKRIVMLHKSKSKRIHLVKYSFIIPLLMVFLMSFNTQEVYVLKQQSEGMVSDIEVLNTSADETKINIIGSENKTLQNSITPLTASKNNSIASQTSGKKITISGTVTDTNSNALPGTNVVVKGKNTGAVSDFNGFYKIEVEKGDVLIFSFIGFKSKIITVKKQKEINVVLEESETNQDKKYTKITIKESETEPIYILDGKTIDKNEVEHILPKNIKSVEVVKDKNSKNTSEQKSVVIITSKDNQAEVVEGKTMSDVKFIVNKIKTDSTTVIRVGKNLEISERKKPLVFVEGEELDYEKLEKINPKNIKSVNVLKDKSAVEKYGEKAKNGVLEIFLIKKD